MELRGQRMRAVPSGERRRLPLLVQSAYSLLRGTSMPRSWVEAAAKAGCGAVALVDWAGLYGAIPFLEAAQSAGLHAVLGAELPVALGPAGPRGAQRAGRIMALCENLSGYRNLAHLLSLIHGGLSRTGSGKPCCDGCGASEWSADPISVLGKNAGGLLLLTDDPWLLGRLRGAIEPSGLAALLPWLEVRSERGEGLQREAMRLGVESVAIPEARMISEAERPTLRLLEAIRRHQLVDPAAVERSGWGGADAPPGTRGRHRREPLRPRRALGPLRSRRVQEPRCLPGAPELHAKLQEDPLLFQAGRRLLERCCFRLSDLRRQGFIFPRIGGSKGPALLRGLCADGLRSRGLERSPKAWGRLEHELDVIEQLGFTDYFLATARITREMHRRGIPTAGRGSGAASLVAYLLGITNVDPIRYGLYFERFLHPLRKDHPDLDIDVAWNRRSEVIEHALGAFGENRAAMIGTHQFFRARGAFRDAARAMGLGDAAIGQAARRLPWRSSPGQATREHEGERDRDQNRDRDPGLDRNRDPNRAHADRDPEDDRGVEGLRALCRDADPTIRRAARGALALVGLPRNIGTHAGGIVLSDGPLSRIVPLERSAAGVVITQFEMHGVRKVGLIKIDFLGNRTLATLAESCETVAATVETAKAEATTVDTGRAATTTVESGGVLTGAGAAAARGATGLDLERIPHDDSDTALLLSAGRTVGCFQIESPAMRSLLRQLRTTTMEGVVAALSLVRPGPSSSGMKQAYIRRVRGQGPPRAINPDLGGILRETRGVPLYEEDIMCLIAGVAGVSYAGADMLRRAIREAMGSGGAQGSDNRELVSLKRGFLAAARRRGKQKAAAAVWDDVARFASYAFCKAHAAGYGSLAYRSAYLKAHYPGPFFAAVLNNQHGMYPARVYVDEARRGGLGLLGPCVHRSGRGWQWESLPEPGGLRCGLGSVRGLREETLKRIVTQRRRPFRDLGDFAIRVSPNSAELEALLMVGAFDEAFGQVRGALLWQMRRLLRTRRGRGDSADRRVSLNCQTALDLAVAPAPGPWRDIKPRHRAQLERRFLGVSLCLHPVRLLNNGPRRDLLPIAGALAERPRRVRLRGIVSAVRRHTGAGGIRILFFTLDDETGLLECVVRGNRKQHGTRRLRVDQFVEAEGLLADAYGSRSLQVRLVRILGEH